MANYPPGLASSLNSYASSYVERDRYERIMREQMYLSQQGTSGKSIPAPLSLLKAADNPILLLLGDG